MLELFFFIAICGFGIASYLDLRYTEFPDMLPYGLITISISIRILMSIILGDFSIITDSVLYGVIFLGIGLGLFYTKQWGDGDAWLLGVLGFVIPNKESMVFVSGYSSILPFQISLIFNFFIVSLLYIIIYSFFVGVKNRKKLKIKFNRKETYVFLGIVVLATFAGTVGIGSSMLPMFYGIMLLLTGFYFFFQYVKSIDNFIFKSRISTKKLREGDVIFEGKWKGLTKKDISKLKRSKKYVYIKEGVRFAPVFLITILLTALFGGLIFI